MRTLALALCFLLISTSFLALRTNAQSIDVSQPIIHGENYLVNNYNQTIGLIRNSPDTSNLSNTYYIYSDNLLAKLALNEWNQSQTNATVIRVLTNITATMATYLQGLPNPKNEFQSLSFSSWAFNASKDYNFSSLHGARIAITLNNGSSLLDSSKYADIALLESLYYAESGQSSYAQYEYQLAVNMWDGRGFTDSAYSSIQGYQTYKIALYLIVQITEKQSVDIDLVNTLLQMQNTTSGGFYTGYNSVYNHLSTVTNTETTALAIIALSLYYNSTSTTDPLKTPIVFNWQFIGEITAFILIVAVIVGFVWKMTSGKH